MRQWVNDINNWKMESKMLIWKIEHITMDFFLRNTHKIHSSPFNSNVKSWRRKMALLTYKWQLEWHILILHNYCSPFRKNFCHRHACFPFYIIERACTVKFRKNLMKRYFVVCFDVVVLCSMEQYSLTEFVIYCSISNACMYYKLWMVFWERKFFQEKFVRIFRTVVVPL